MKNQKKNQECGQNRNKRSRLFYNLFIDIKISVFIERLQINASTKIKQEN